MASAFNIEECKVSSDPGAANSYYVPCKENIDESLICQLSFLNSILIEPEWEEDDVYLSHRKDALKTMRLASRHSRAAADAFLRDKRFVMSLLVFVTVVMLVVTEAGTHLVVTLAIVVPIILIHALLWITHHHSFDIEDHYCNCTCEVGADGPEKV
ncbi:hypothetical protein AHAS_Ahas11G0215900 [Arachis hypogaea]